MQCKTGFIIASLKFSVKVSTRIITSIFPLTFRQIQAYADQWRFFTGVNTFWIVQNNKIVINAINKLNNREKESSLLTFLLSILNGYVINI